MPTAPKKGKPAAPKPTAARADHGAETYNLKDLCALLRILKPHAGFGTLRTGTDALKNVMLVGDGDGVHPGCVGALQFDADMSVEDGFSG
jgi:hypothetical protein